MTSAFRPFVEALGVLAAFPSRSSRQPLFITAATKFNQLSVQVLYGPSYTRVLFVFHSPFYIFFFLYLENSAIISFLGCYHGKSVERNRSNHLLSILVLFIGNGQSSWMQIQRSRIPAL